MRAQPWRALFNWMLTNWVKLTPGFYTASCCEFMVNRRRGGRGALRATTTGAGKWNLTIRNASALPTTHPSHNCIILEPPHCFTALIDCACVLLKPHTIVWIVNNRPHIVSNHPKKVNLMHHLPSPSTYPEFHPNHGSNAEYSLFRDLTLSHNKIIHHAHLSCEIMEVLQSKALFENTHNKSIHHPNIIALVWNWVGCRRVTFPQERKSVSWDDAYFEARFKIHF